mmetsp:Transcript_2183/g.5064  ORF Transcript_2183/g.5064 Transcript_2183/m.5064 type:complete len:244 (+) Transcript_2183:67-798(+)|eukprot:CAMPEP_0170603256 /NCGR_PEP_ID=MMETSP0224-20130122/18817_1 /TAXON_ID=285029 /ORGANISM="Togula jolla, Strain CCCM 725" /LENGTH=243 /DNA_ID=CAMNT_0010928129 /DNA_START=61 /DNA_END=792 /DNA_ORIENTATION=-
MTPAEIRAAASEFQIPTESPPVKSKEEVAAEKAAAEAAAHELHVAKDTYAKEHGYEPCLNPKCLSPTCTCGANCTCNINPKVKCDNCAVFKAAKKAEESHERFLNAQAVFDTTIKPECPGATFIKAAELMEMMMGPEPPMLLDARSAEEMEISALEGAQASPELDANRLSVCYSSTGRRAGLLAEKLQKENPAAKVAALELGLVGWCHAGGALVSEGNPTTMVHGGSELNLEFFPTVGYQIVL